MGDSDCSRWSLFRDFLLGARMPRKYNRRLLFYMLMVSVGCLLLTMARINLRAIDEVREKEVLIARARTLEDDGNAEIRRHARYDAAAHMRTRSPTGTVSRVDKIVQQTDSGVEYDSHTLAEKRSEIKDMFLHAWKGYREKAWGHDELTPVDGHYSDHWGGWGITLVDSLDSLVLLDLKDELAEARKFVEGVTFGGRRGVHVSFFETTIRHLGGLLGAYTLTNDSIYLEKATVLAERMMPGFNTRSGAAVQKIDLAAKEPIFGYVPCLAEVGSVQLEFTYLSKLTGDKKYASAANQFYDMLWEDRKARLQREAQALKEIVDLDRTSGDEEKTTAQRPDGLWPLFFNVTTGLFSGDTFSIGGQADSFYEYLLKLWLLNGKQDGWLRVLYDEAVDAMRRHLLGYSGGRTYVGALKSGALTKEMDHLSCFAPGMFALGSNSSDSSQMKLAEHLAETCYGMYRGSPSGLGPEIAIFDAGRPYANEQYQLRPETLESLFVMYRSTHDPKYRDQAWAIYLAIQKHCKTPYGYSGISSVVFPGRKDNVMPSFFLAETVKYLYLIFSDDSVLPLDRYVLSTEAHPFAIS
ncbi:alpha-1,2-Mannosidase [Diplonema papillatum]|nr:alpha-1,2-Mannosidase [Diplonema papillatum]